MTLAFADSVDQPYAEDVTADFVYLRPHSSEELYASGYPKAALDDWAARLRLRSRGEEPAGARLIAPALPRASRRAPAVYVYFDNDAKAHSPFDAKALAARLARG